MQCNCNACTIFMQFNESAKAGQIAKDSAATLLFVSHYAARHLSGIVYCKQINEYHHHHNHHHNHHHHNHHNHHHHNHHHHNHHHHHHHRYHDNASISTLG